MPSALVNSTIQACILTATSNFIAQFITAYKTNSPFTIQWTPVFQFVIFTAFTTPPNFLWQSYLEASFPSSYLVPSTSTSDEKELDRKDRKHDVLESKLSIPNTIFKFILDQTVGAAVNTLLFSLVFAGFNGAGYAEAIQVAGEEFWPLIYAGWKLWPMVSVTNYAFVKSVEGRTLVGSLAGMGWGVYMSLMRS